MKDPLNILTPHQREHLEQSQERANDLHKLHDELDDSIITEKATKVILALGPQIDETSLVILAHVARTIINMACTQVEGMAGVQEARDERAGLSLFLWEYTGCPPEDELAPTN